jgi:hypothetical protein
MDFAVNVHLEFGTFFRSYLKISKKEMTSIG